MTAIESLRDCACLRAGRPMLCRSCQRRTGTVTPIGPRPFRAAADLPGLRMRTALRRASLGVGSGDAD